MSLPSNALSSPTYPADFLDPDSVVRNDPLIDYERGGVGLNDPSQGLLIRNWRARLVGSDVKVCADPFDPLTEVIVYSAAGITELSLAFDQNMRPSLAYLQGDVCKLYWFDSFAAAAVTTTIASGVSSVFMTLDDKRAVSSQVNANDMLLIYLKGPQLCMRQQRDRFATEYVLDTFIEDVPPHVLRVGMGNQGRLLIDVGTRDTGGDASIGSLQRWKLPVQYVVPTTSELSNVAPVPGAAPLVAPRSVILSVKFT